MDIVCRVILDRQWTVGDLASWIVRYCRQRLELIVSHRSEMKSVQRM